MMTDYKLEIMENNTHEVAAGVLQHGPPCSYLSSNPEISGLIPPPSLYTYSHASTHQLHVAIDNHVLDDESLSASPHENLHPTYRFLEKRVRGVHKAYGRDS